MSDTEQAAKHVRILGGLSLALAGLYLLALLVIRFVVGLATFPTPPVEAIQWLSPFGFILLLMGALAALALASGIGLLRYDGWARITTLVLAVINLFSFPFGTAFGVYGIWVLTRPEVKRVLSSPARSKAS